MPQRRHHPRRFLATVLFTDIVGSTQRAAELGDRAWRDLVEKHHAVVRRELRSYSGREMDSAGDGFFAVFETPERAVRAAAAMTASLAPLGIDIRAGVHTGECEMISGKVGGMTVVIGARIAALARAGEVLVSGSVRDLMVGSGVRFEGGEPSSLKGVEDLWRVYRLVDLGGGGTTTARRRLVPLYTRRRRRGLFIAVLVVLVVVAVAVPIALLRPGRREGVILGENSVGLVAGNDPGQVGAAVRVGQRPTGVAIGAGAVWVTNSISNTVTRIDRRTRTATPIPVGGSPSGVAVGGGAVWVANAGDATVSRIDPRTNEVTVTRVPAGPTGVVVAAGSVWVTNALDASLTELDPVTGDVRHVIAVGGGPTGVAFGAGSLWVTNQADGTVSRVNPATRDAEATITVGNGPSGVAFGDGAVWVANTIDGSLSRIGVSDQSVTSRTLTANGGAYGVATLGRTVWVSNEYAGTLSQVSSRRFTLVSTVPTKGAPLGLAADGEGLWFANAAGGRLLHRGGTLTVAAQALGESGEDPSVLDPGDTYDVPLWGLESLMNDGLVAFRRAGGAQGALLVPDLATALPTPTDGGRTYTFHLREGVRYSTGALVRPADVRRGLERALQNPGGLPAFYSAILGATRCRHRPSACDLSAGVVVDDTARTVTFRLTRPDPDLLNKLALPVASAVPVDTPTHLAAGTTLPATGPYLVRSYQPQVAASRGHPARRGRLELIRNPEFREWSRAAQPDGFPDRMTFVTGLSASETVAQVADGRADAVWEGVPSDGADRLRELHPGQVHSNAGSFIYYVFLNTTVPPFDNVDARRAVAFAMDRRSFAHDPQGIVGDSQVTCQVLPPYLQGYDPYCPYTLGGDASGEWSAPDLGRATQLVRESGTRGMRVTVPVTDNLRGPARHLAELLTVLGYRASLRELSSTTKYFDYIVQRSHHVQAGVSGWGPDYPSMASFLPALASCDFSTAFNLSFFCDRGIDREITLALAEQTADPGAAAVQWRTIDHALVDQAPIVPFGVQQRHDFVSRRVGNFTYHPLYHLLPGQLWVQ